MGVFTAAGLFFILLFFSLFSPWSKIFNAIPAFQYPPPDFMDSTFNPPMRHDYLRVTYLIFMSYVSFASWLGVLYMLYFLVFPYRLEWDLFANIEKPIVSFLVEAGRSIAFLIAILLTVIWLFVLFSKLMA